MRIFKNLFTILLVFIIGGIGFYNYKMYFTDPCDETITYRLGRFDEQFGISEDYLKKQIEVATLVWEKETGKDLFVYDDNGKLQINLIYDDRQKDTLLKQRTEYGLGTIESSLGVLDSKFAELKKEYDTLSLSYNREELDFNRRKENYEKSVSSWNSKGGAPEKQYTELQKEASYLKSEADRLNQKANLLNQKAKESNLILEERNKVAEQYNQSVRSYNEKYGHGLEFNQGEYNGQEINLYQFKGEKDLQAVLVHELGHALGMEHVDDPNSVMYYLIEENKNYKLALSSADLVELQRVCKIKK